MNYTVLPKCPVCLKRYSKEVRPLSLQPCSHGICEECLRNYRSVQDDVRCPKCREVIIEEKPNYDLIEMIPEAEYNWSQQLVDIYDKEGVTLHVHDQVDVFSKVLLQRLLHTKEIDTFSDVDTNKYIINQMKKDLKQCIVASDIPFDEFLNWIDIMALPVTLEHIIIKFIIKIYKQKDFLKEMDAEWILEIMPVNHV